MTLKKIRREDEVDPSDRREEQKMLDEKNGKAPSGKKRRTGR